MALFSLYAATLPCICQTKTCMAGIDISSLLNRYVDIQVGYSFAEHWSASGEAAIAFKGHDARMTEKEREHQEEFGPAGKTVKSSTRHHESLLLHYWIQKAFKGISIGFGIQTDNQSVHPLAQLGYTFMIWKGISISPALRTDGLRIGVNYIF